MRTAASFARVLALLCLLTPGLLSADPPPGYYDEIDPRTQDSLRSSIHETVDDHVRFPYTSSNTDTWNILEEADEDPEDPTKILDVYKNASYTKIGGGTGPYNREHSWPNSYGFPSDGSSNYPYTDCHALFLSDSSENSSRGNNPYRTCASGCSERPTVLNHGRGGGTGVYPGNSNWRTGSGSTGSWETWRGRRGDVARALLYLDLRYEGGVHGVTGVSEPDLILTDNPALIVTSGGSNASVAYMGLLSTLLAWHEEDPVDDLERHRNDVIGGYQQNRNPFIDHPEWTDCAYGNDCGSFYTVTPCRVIDTRREDGPFGGPILSSGMPRSFTIPGQCGIPATAESVSANVTIVMPSDLGHLTFYPGGEAPPLASSINFSAGQVRANNAILRISTGGILATRAIVAGEGQVHVIVDVNGYFD